MKTHKFLEKVNRAKVLVATGAVGLLSIPRQVSAAGVGGTNEASSVVANAIEVMVQIGGGLGGAVFVILGLIKLLTAYHNGQPQEMHASVKDIIVGAAFLGLALFISPAMGLFGL